MKKLNKLIATMLALACAVTALVMPINVKAEEQTYQHRIVTNYENDGHIHSYEYLFNHDGELCLFSKGGNSYGIMTANGAIYVYMTKHYYDGITDGYNNATFTSGNDTIIADEFVECDYLIFDTEQEARNYIASGIYVRKYANANSVGVQICYDVYDTFEIAVPKKVELSKGSAETIPMNVKGDLAGLSTLDITPEATMTLTQSPKDPVTVTLNMEKGSFSFTELLGDGQSTGITIDTSGLPAGEWTGSCIVNVNITDHTGE